VIKEIVLLKRRAEVPAERFARWLASPDAPRPAAGLLRQVLDRPHASSKPEVIGATQDVDALLETWLEAADAPGAGLAGLPELAALLDPARSVAFLAREVTVGAPDGAGFKICSLLRRPEGTSYEAFSHHWEHVHAPLVRSVPEFWGRMRGYVQNHALPGSARDLAGRPVAGFDGVAQLWFDDDATAVAAYGAPRYLELVRPDEANLRGGPTLRLLAEEVALFR